MNITQILQNYGLKENQARVFVACLELGSASILKISQKAQLPRSTCEVILGTLQQRGFVSSHRKKRTKYYAAEDPHKLIGRAKEQIKLLEGTLPELLAVYGRAKVRPTVRFYEGKTGIKSVFEEMLGEADEIFGFGSPADLFNTLVDDFEKIVAQRLANKIPARLIHRDSPKARERQRLGPQQLRQVRIAPDIYDYHGMFIIWKNKIAMFSLQNDLVALVIESPELVAVQRAMLNLIWNSLPPGPKT